MAPFYRIGSFSVPSYRPKRASATIPSDWPVVTILRPASDFHFCRSAQADQSPATGFDILFDNSGTYHYRSVEFSIDRPIRTDFRILASYIYSNAEARPSLSLDFPDPTVKFLPEAPVEWNATHRFVSWGYFPLPSHFNASFSV